MQILLGSFVAALLLTSLGVAHAEDLGVYGQTYVIKERDAIDVFKETVAKKLANGGKERMIKGAQDRYLGSLSNVVTPQGVHAATVSQVRRVDLSEVVKETIRDTNGLVVVAAGTRINPLVLGGLSKKLFFIDAKDKKQIELVKRRANPEDKVILLGGSVFEAGKSLNRRVYLDVPGLHTRMKIVALPSIASQEGALLRVEEVKL